MKSYDSLLDGDVELQKEIQGVIQQRIQQGIQQELQRMVLDVVEVRFPTLLEVAKEKVIQLEDKNVLRVLAKQIMLAPDETYARLTLESFAA